MNAAVRILTPSRPQTEHEQGASPAPEPLAAAFDREEYDLALVKSLIQHSHDAIITKDLDGTITYWNPAATRMYGWSAGEMVGQSIFKLIPERLYDEEKLIIARLTNGEVIEHLETVRLTSDGREIDVHLSISPLKDASGRVIGASKIARNVTEQRAAERARMQLAAIIESSDDAIIAKTLDGIITSWNGAAERMFGYSAAEMIGQPVLNLIPGHLKKEEANILAELRAGHRIDHYETVRVHRDGSLIPVSLSISPVRDGSGRIIGAAKIARDLSRRRAAGAALIQSHSVQRGVRSAAFSMKELLDPADRLTRILKQAEQRVRPGDEMVKLITEAEVEMDRLNRFSAITAEEIRGALKAVEASIVRLTEALGPDDVRVPGIE